MAPTRLPRDVDPTRARVAANDNVVPRDYPHGLGHESAPP
jgi:hypothetical protein